MVIQVCQILLGVRIQFIVSPFWDRLYFDKCYCPLTNVAEFWSEDVDCYKCHYFCFNGSLYGFRALFRSKTCRNNCALSFTCLFICLSPDGKGARRVEGRSMHNLVISRNAKKLPISVHFLHLWQPSSF